MSQDRFPAAGICIGGPCAGQYIESERDVVIVPERTSVELATAEADIGALTVKTHVYRFAMIHTPDGAWGYWHPDGQTPLETLRMLADSYCEAHRPTHTMVLPEHWARKRRENPHGLGG